MSSIDKYILRDYTFLNDYVIIQDEETSLDNFIAKIKDTEQYVRFHKIPFHQNLIPRFENLVQLFNKGIILADNIFILEESGSLFFYVIEAYLQQPNERFQTLHHLVNRQCLEQSQKKIIMDKVKVLLDCLHQIGEPYVGITSMRIIIDDEENIYLAPYPLAYELKTDRYSVAYYSPQLLQSQIDQQSSRIIESDKNMLMKNDIWAFGCISMEIYAYSSPLFYSLNNPLQLDLIEEFASNPKNFYTFQSEEPLVANIMLNCLEIDPRRRKLVTEREDEQKTINREPIRIGEGDSEFIFHVICLSGVEISKQMRINIFLDRQYSFFASKVNKKRQLYEIDRKIELKANLCDLYPILSEPILLEIIENEKKSKIRVNLSTLVLIVDEKRVWQKPLIGSYSTKGKGNYPSGKIKLNCFLKTPTKLSYDPFLEEVRNKKQPEIKTKPSAKRLNPLSAINDNLSEITQKWKEKIHHEQQENSQLSQRVKRLLIKN